jgi:hypothetical protein
MPAKLLLAFFRVKIDKVNEPRRRYARREHCLRLSKDHFECYLISWSLETGTEGLRLGEPQGSSFSFLVLTEGMEK